MNLRGGAFVLLLGSSSAWAVDAPIAVTASPPPQGGKGRVQIVVDDPALLSVVSAAPLDVLHVISGGAEAVVKGAQPVSAQHSRTVIAVDQSRSFARHWDEAFDLAAAIAGGLPQDGSHTLDVVTFGTRLDEVGSGSDPTSALAVLQQARGLGARQGATRLRNFIREAAQLAEQGLPLASGGLRQVVVFTDAGEESSAWSVADVVRDARALGVRIDVVAWDDQGRGVAGRLDEVSQIALGTGGRYLQVGDVAAARVTMQDIVGASSRAWWLELEWCGLAPGQPIREESLWVEVWQAGARRGASASVPYQQSVSGDALTACSAVAAGSTSVPPPSASTSASASGSISGFLTRNLPRFVAAALFFGVLFVLAGLMLLRALFSRRMGGVGPATPSAAPSPPAPAPPPEVISPIGAVASPFAPVDEPVVGASAVHVLVRVDADGPPPSRVVLTKPRSTVGGVRSASVFIDDQRISSRHASLVLEPDGGLIVVDEGSTNGTWVNGRKLAANAQARLVPGQLVAFSSTIRYRLDSTGAASSQRWTRGATVFAPPPVERASDDASAASGGNFGAAAPPPAAPARHAPPAGATGGHSPTSASDIGPAVSPPRQSPPARPVRNQTIYDPVGPKKDGSE